MECCNPSLPTLLEGEALAVLVWLEVPEDEQNAIATVKEKLIERMMPMEFVSLEQFHGRKLRPGEALSMFTHDLKKLLGQAIPGLTDEAARGQLLLHQFLAGIPEAISRPIRASGGVKNLDKAVERARLLMTVNEADNPGYHRAAVVTETQQNGTQKLEEQVAILTEQVAALSARERRGPSSGLQGQSIRCFKCNRLGTLRRECPERQGTRGNQRCQLCGRWGHSAQFCRQRNYQGASSWNKRPQFNHQGNDQGMPTWDGRYPQQQ